MKCQGVCLFKKKKSQKKSHTLILFIYFHSLDAVRKCPHARDATDKEVEQYVARWLQLAPDRDGGRKERAKSAASNTSFERQ